MRSTAAVFQGIEHVHDQHLPGTTTCRQTARGRAKQAGPGVEQHREQGTGAEGQAGREA